MKQHIKTLMARIDALSLRERGLLLLSLVFVLYSIWNGFFMGPLTKHHQQVQAQLKQMRTDITKLGEQSDEISRRQTEDPDAENNAKLTALRAELAVLDQRIKAETQALIDPKVMNKVLEDILKDEPGLRVISINSIAKKGLLETAAQLGEQPVQSLVGIPGIYQHGLNLVFEGGYLNALHYLQTLESLPWGLFWDSVEFKVEKYPVARFTITVHTISLREGWIGV